MKVCLLGVDFLSANRGCGALGYSTIKILSDVCKEKHEMLEIYGIIHHMGKLALPDSSELSVALVKIEPKKPAFWKEIFNLFKKSDFIMDFTGGDSFSDLYGKKRFYLASAIKQLAIWSGRPFIMGPQTIGPFASWDAEKFAGHLIRKSSSCWTRDRLSQEYTEKICGIRPQLTTDVAFALPTVKTVEITSPKKKIGFNPSGLLWSKNHSFEAEKHIYVDYRAYVQNVLGELVRNPEYEIYLFPHVFDRNNGFGENDLTACREIQQMFPETKLVLNYDSPMEAKGMIAQMDVFIGARMHATIAAFSSGVAVIPFSYSRKFEGLYSDLDYPYLISGEKMSTEEAVSRTMEWIQCDKLLRQKIAEARPIVESKQKKFYDMLKSL